jgi:hypothetical protein
MSRIRSIHPGIWTDEEFVGLSSFARLLFIGIWNECDDKGMFVWSPLQLKMRVLPADNVDAAALLDELEAANSIRKYEIGGKSYGAVRNFAKFQRPKKPNDIHPASPQILAFAGHGGEPSKDEEEEMGNRFPTPSEKSPQMEDGGWRMEEIETTSCETDVSLKPEHVVEIWNKTADKLGKPRVRDITPERRQLLKARIAQYSVDDFIEVFGKIEKSKFLRGDTGWRGCRFDWVFKKANFQKIIEGNYDE